METENMQDCKITFATPETFNNDEYRLILTENWFAGSNETISLLFDDYDKAVKTAKKFVDQEYHAVIVKEE